MAVTSQRESKATTTPAKNSCNNWVTMMPVGKRLFPVRYSRMNTGSELLMCKNIENESVSLSATGYQIQQKNQGLSRKKDLLKNVKE